MHLMISHHDKCLESDGSSPKKLVKWIGDPSNNWMRLFINSQSEMSQYDVRHIKEVCMFVCRKTGNKSLTSAETPPAGSLLHWWNNWHSVVNSWSPLSTIIASFTSFLFQSCAVETLHREPLTCIGSLHGNVAQFSTVFKQSLQMVLSFVRPFMGMDGYFRFRSLTLWCHLFGCLNVGSLHVLFQRNRVYLWCTIQIFHMIYSHTNKGLRLQMHACLWP